MCRVTAQLEEEEEEQGPTKRARRETPALLELLRSVQAGRLPVEQALTQLQGLGRSHEESTDMED